MITKLFCTISFSIFFLFSGQLTAQENPLEEGNVPHQFDHAIEESSKYEEYRVVPTAWLYQLKSNVVDSLNEQRSQVEEREASIDSLKEEMSALNDELESVRQERDEAIASKNSLQFFGRETPKGQYNSIMWGLVIVLALAVLFFFFLFKRSQIVTRQVKERYDVLEKEYDAHKKRALEKEQNMARQHLNELNKLRGRE